MFPRSGTAIASGRQYREKNLFLEIFGAVRLIIAIILLLIYFGVINPFFSSKELNNAPPVEESGTKIINNIYDGLDLSKSPEEISSQKAKINKSEALKQYDRIRHQVF